LFTLYSLLVPTIENTPTRHLSVCDDPSIARPRLSPKGKKDKKLDKKTMLSKPFPVFGAPHADDEDEMEEESVDTTKIRARDMKFGRKDDDDFGASGSMNVA